MTTAVENFKANIEAFKTNPIGIQRAAINLLVEASNNQIDIVDPTSPFVFLSQSSAILAASAISENQILNRKQYAAAAQTPDDLYVHMSDKDYANRFAVPCTAKFVFMIEKLQLLDSLVLDPTTGIRKIVIPRNTKVVVAETTFSLQYPVEIRQMAHGGLQVVYDAEVVSPLYTLESNLISRNFITADSGTEYLAFELLMHQFDITVRTAAINSSSVLTLNVDLTDQYYYCRVWVDNGDGTFSEIATTHTDEIYDPLTPTAVLKVVDKTVTVKIPQVYVNTGLMNKSLRVDVYETKGPVDLSLANYSQDQFVATFLAINPHENDQYTAPLKTLRNIALASRSVTQGGSDGLSFEELRLNVMQNAIGTPSQPITNVQIESTLRRNGYNIVKNIDNITNRVFLATRAMPAPSDEDLLTSASAGIGTLSVKASEAVTINTVVDNGNLITITPDTIYRLKNGVLELVPVSEIAFLQSLPVDQQALLVTNGAYFYSPFHYVMDSNNNEFDLRAYYLDNPYIASRSFVGENDTTLLQVSTGDSNLVRTPTGYKLHVSTSSSDAYKDLQDDQCFAELAFTPTGDSARAYLKGTLIGHMQDTNERVFEFDLSTTYAIGSDDELALTKFTQFNETPRIINVPLETTFDLLYSTNATMGAQWVLSPFDNILGYYELPPNTKAITYEKIKLHLGDPLKRLWCRARSVVSENQYQRWLVDDPATYLDDVYQRDPVTGASFSVVGGQMVYNKIHSKGDPVLDGNGDPVFRNRAGDIKYDNYGVPILISSRDMLRQMDIMLIEGSYHFATNQVSINYRQELVNKVVTWLTEDLPTMGNDLLEQTVMYYYPTTTIGNVKATVSNGLTVTLDAGQFFSVRLSVRDNVYKNPELRDAISKKTVKTISSVLSNAIVAASDIVDALREQYKDDVIGINFSGLGGVKDYDVVIMNDDSTRLSIRKRLIARSDESLALEEDVSIEFVNLDARKVG